MKIKVLFLSNSLQLSGSTTWMNSLIDAFQSAGIPCAHLITSIETEIESTAKKVYYTGRARNNPIVRIMRLLQLHKVFIKYYNKKEDLFFNKYVEEIFKNNNEKVLVIKDFNNYLPTFLERNQFTVVAVMHNQFTCYEVGYYRDYLFSVSHAVMRKSNDLGFDVKGFICNPLNIESIQKKSIQYVPSESDFFLFVGKMHIEKGILHLLQVYHELLIEGKIRQKLIYLGSGRDQYVLEEYVKKHNLSSNVVFKGFVSNPYPYIRKATLLVLPSYSEAMPYVAIESAVLKTNYLVSDFPGADEFFPKRNIFIMNDEVRVFNKNLKESVLDLLRNPSYLLKEGVIDKINPQEVANSYYELLGE